MRRLTQETLRECFYGDEDSTHGYTLIYGAGDLGDYEENLWCVLSKDGELFEYEDSHCFCNGFEFNPQPVTVEYLRKQIPTTWRLEHSEKVEALDAVNAFLAEVKQ